MPRLRPRGASAVSDRLDVDWTEAIRSGFADRLGKVFGADDLALRSLQDHGGAHAKKRVAGTCAECGEQVPSLRVRLPQLSEAPRHREPRIETVELAQLLPRPQASRSGALTEHVLFHDGEAIVLVAGCDGSRVEKLAQVSQHDAPTPVGAAVAPTQAERARK